MRYEDWVRRLQKVIEAARTKDFEWGAHDCFLLAADGCLAVCGTDPAKPWRGRYTTPAGAIRHIKKHRGGLAGGFDDCFKRLDTPMLAQRGDAALLDYERAGINACGIVMGRNVLTTAERGITALPLERALIAWRVE